MLKTSDGNCSCPCCLRNGVPQWSYLSPILFNIYIYIYIYISVTFLKLSHASMVMLMTLPYSTPTKLAYGGGSTHSRHGPNFRISKIVETQTEPAQDHRHTLPPEQQGIQMATVCLPQWYPTPAQPILHILRSELTVHV